MYGMLLELAALLLALASLAFCLTSRHDLYLPLPRDLRELLSSSHSVFVVLLVVSAVSAVFACATSAVQYLRAGAGLVMLACTLHHLFQVLQPFLLALYARDLCVRGDGLSSRSLAIVAVPALAGCALVLANPLTGACFFLDEASRVVSGTGVWVLDALAVVYLAYASVCLLRAGDVLPRYVRRHALALVALALAGIGMELVWGVPIRSLFWAVALFGAMVLLEPDDVGVEGGARERLRTGTVVAMALVFAATIVANAVIIQGVSGSQIERVGTVELEAIKGDLEDTISSAKTDVLSVAMGAEELIDAGASRKELEEYFYARREGFLTDDDFMNVYIAGPDWHVVPYFDAPPDFHAAERIWYLGAAEMPGEVYVTEPYKDADTGAMCFTVSTQLSGGEAVVGLDLSLAKAQETIMRMAGEDGQTAMIVTSAGAIAGYSDMSLVGENADQKLPAYAEVLDRVASSQEHGSFVTEIDGRTCKVFSSETSNGWYLVLSVDSDTLYAESRQQMAVMASIDLLMLALVGIFYAASARSRRGAASALAQGERFMEGLAAHLTDASAQAERLGDWRFVEEGANPEAVIAEIGRSGQRLGELAKSVRAHASLMRAQAQEEQVGERRRRNTSSGAPSIRMRTHIIATLLVALAAVLAFSVRSAISYGDSLMAREADAYEHDLSKWVGEQRAILYSVTDMISARPSLMDDYDEAVALLDNLTDRYSDVSACFMANPYKDPPVIMNTGWIPSDDYRPETRPWYKAAERSPDHFSISAPYLDVPTGTYCITLARVVYGDDGQFLGVFGMDFFLDKLISVLGESYTTDAYAFLVDSDSTVVNHPNPAYQMSEDLAVSVEDTEYAEAYHGTTTTILTDYAGQLMACVARKSESGFTSMVAKSWWSVYGGVILMTLAFLALFGACTVVVVVLINRLTRWQDEVNQRLVEAADAAQAADRAKSQFLAQMSHEIRTPMNAIIGLGSLALRDQSISSRTRDQLEKIDASAQHLLSLINDILDMSRIESGRMELKEEEFSFGMLLEQVRVIIGGQCAEKGLRFECETIGEVDERLVGDSLKLREVLINILGNSVKFTETPGIVTLVVEQTDESQDSCVLRFEMRDTGVGMDSDFIPKLFEAFSQEDGSTTNRYGGSGLGMAITKSMVEMMGGTIDVQSKKGVGSTFTVTVRVKRLPEAAARDMEKPHPDEAVPDVAEVAGEEVAEPHADEVSLEGVHVLVVEDQQMNAEILIDLLDLEEMTCEWAMDGQRAVDLFRASEQGHFDVILMDMRMPVMDGLEATRSIRSLDHPDAATIPIVALTANAFEEDVKNCLEAGMDAHLSKPVDIELLVEALTKLLAKRKGTDATS